MSFLELQKISYTDPGGFTLQELSLILDEGKRIAFAGETGSGKTTVLKLISGLMQPSSGKVLLKGEQVRGPVQSLVPGNERVAYLSQFFELQKFLRVEQILNYASRISSMATERIYRICEIEHLLERKTDQLSGGERQRIALARLLVMAPDLLLLDEPYSNLDSAHRIKMKSVVDKIGDQLGITSILVSHDSFDTLPWADEIYILKNGSVVQHGPPEMIYRRPVDEYVGALFGKYNLITIDPGVSETKAFLRPDDLIITKEEDCELTGEVKKISFAGPYFEVNVNTPQGNITVLSGMPDFKVGDRINLKVIPERVHFL